MKDNYSLGTEESKIKRLQRFLSNEAVNPEKLYEFFTYKLLQMLVYNKVWAKYAHEMA